MSESTCDRCEEPMAKEDERECEECSETVCFRCFPATATVCIDWGAAVPGNTEEQVARIIAETIRRREAEQTQLMNLMRERAQSNPMIFRLNRAIQEAWKEPLKVKPRSKRGQRVRRWR